MTSEGSHITSLNNDNKIYIQWLVPELYIWH